MLDTAAASKIQNVLTSLNHALVNENIDSALELFVENCYWRDLLSFTWNLKTAEGKDEIRDLLEQCLGRIKPHDWIIDRENEATQADGITEGWIAFETNLARGYGYIRLKDGFIWTLLTTMSELKGYEEPGRFNRPLGAKHGQRQSEPTWKEEREYELTHLGINKQPYVVIIGGGQGAIGLGARLRHHGVPTIIVEKNARAGDSWRQRYKSLCLHDPVWYDHMPYIKFPENWPVFSPKDKIADWLEMYAKVMELNYWANTEAKQAQYDPDQNCWKVIVQNQGREIELAPRQLVLATGMSGKPNVPDIKGQDRFRGIQLHSSEHRGQNQCRANEWP